MEIEVCGRELAITDAMTRLWAKQKLNAEPSMIPMTEGGAR